MKADNIWGILKQRYRFSTKTQMNFELSFPDYLIGKCRFEIENARQIRSQKVSPSLQGLVFSDTIPLSWFTSSVLIPWGNLLEMRFSDTSAAIDGSMDSPISSHGDKETRDVRYCTLRLNDPEEMVIELPWSGKFTDYIKKNRLFDL